MDRRLLLKLYPRGWRSRYAEEFLAVLDEIPLTPRAIVDVVAGAVDARMSGFRQSRSARRRRMPEWLLVLLIASTFLTAPSVLRGSRRRIRLLPAYLLG